MAFPAAMAGRRPRARRRSCANGNCGIARPLRWVRRRGLVWLNARSGMSYYRTFIIPSSSGGSHPTDSVLPRSEELGHAEGVSTGFVVASGGCLCEGYRHGGPGVCLGDGRTEAEGVPSQGGRGDALLRRMPPYMT